jgi:hypothetical protein
MVLLFFRLPSSSRTAFLDIIVVVIITFVGCFCRSSFFVIFITLVIGINFNDFTVIIIIIIVFGCSFLFGLSFCLSIVFFPLLTTFES